MTDVKPTVVPSRALFDNANSVHFLRAEPAQHPVGRNKLLQFESIEDIMRGQVRPAQKGSCRKEGEYWTFGIGGKIFQLKDSKGLAYLAHLLRYPVAEFHVLDLVAGVASSREGDSERLLPAAEAFEKAGIQIGNLGKAGELLDDQAKTAYRCRLSELREELEEAKGLGKTDGAGQLENEIDALNNELLRAAGLGGRKRRAASALEQARQSVTKRLKATLTKIAEVDSTLGAILSRGIRTGNFCSYRPDPNFPIAWEFGAIAVPPRRPASQDDPTAKPQTDFLQSPGLAVSLLPLVERTTFVGREIERQAIRRAIDRALNGDCSMVMIGGGPGVGKTRLAMEMAEYASQAGFRCFVGHCYEEEQIPYLPFVEIVESSLAQTASLDNYRHQIGDSAAELAQLAPIVRKIFPDIPPPMELPPAEMRRHLFQSLAEMLARLAQKHPLLMFLDDLQWADESTLALLIHLATRIAQRRIAIIGTYRDGFSDQGPALIRTLEELIRLGIRPLKIGGLCEEDVAQMLAALSGRQAPQSLARLIFEESQGNPFFVEEVYRHLMEEGKVFDSPGHFRTDIKIDEVGVPENVRLIINRRLQRLNSDEKKVLEATAVIGRSFSFQLLSDVAHAQIDKVFDVIEKAQQMGIVVSSNQGPEIPFTFVHELVRQTMLAGMLPPARARLHSRVATAIERLDTGSLNRCAGGIADHLLKAGPFQQANITATP